jgi:hypothetical protein
VIAKSQDRFRRPLVKEDDFRCPERLPSTSALERTAFAVARLMRARHRFRGFAADDPASGALSPLATLSRGGARPVVVIHGLFVHGREGRTPPVDFCNRYDPRARLRISGTPQNPAGGRPPAQLLSSSPSFDVGHELRMATPLARRGQPRGHGSGALARSISPRTRHLPPRSLTVEASPQPDRLGHLLSQPVASTGWSPCIARAARLELPITSVPRRASPKRWSRRPAAVRRRGRAASRTPPRRGARSAAPEVPSIVG